MDVEAIARACEAGARPKLAHIIPNFHNPGGYTLSLEKRRRLIDLAKTYDFVIFEDDPYVELRFEGETLPTMLSLDDADRVVYASSFSKTVCPGIRVGYLAGPAGLIADIVKTATNTYISPSMVSQSIVNEFCRSGALEGSIETVKNALRERRDALCAALERELPDASFTPPSGGYFLWVDLPEGADVGAARRGREGARRRVRARHGLPARGRPQQPAPRLLRRDRRADRGGRRPSGRGLPRRGCRRCLSPLPRDQLLQVRERLLLGGDRLAVRDLVDQCAERAQRRVVAERRR